MWKTKVLRAVRLFRMYNRPNQHITWSPYKKLTVAWDQAKYTHYTDPNYSESP